MEKNYQGIFTYGFIYILRLKIRVRRPPNFVAHYFPQSSSSVNQEREYLYSLGLSYERGIVSLFPLATT